MFEYGNMKIIIVDDSELVRERLQALLEENPSLNIIGHAGNSTEAMKIIADKKPDAVILDISMPGENGIEILKKIRKTNRKIIVIMLTNYPSKHYKAECYKLGVDYFFDKSSEFQLLPDVLGELANGAFIVPF